MTHRLVCDAIVTTGVDLLFKLRLEHALTHEDKVIVRRIGEATVINWRSLLLFLIPLTQIHINESFLTFLLH